MTRKRDLLTNIVILARLIRTEADRRARAHGMTRAQWTLMVRLEAHPGLLQKELAEILEVEPITVARLVDRLEARGMVERRPDPTDRRCWRLHLTEAAQPLLGEIDLQLTDLASTLCQGVGEDALAITSTTLSRMRDRAQEQRNSAGEPPPSCDPVVDVSICAPPAQNRAPNGRAAGNPPTHTPPASEPALETTA